MHPWRDIDRSDRIEDFFPAVIEVPNSGFLPQTYCAAGDPLDVLVLGRSRWSRCAC